MSKRPTNKPYIYAVNPDGVLRFWTGIGFIADRKEAKRFSTDAEAELVLRQMMLDNIKAKISHLA